MLGPFEVEVRDGVVVEVRRDGESILGQRPAEAWSGYLTIDGLFAEIERSLPADELTVVYDGELGYPRSLRSDPDLGTSDDELGVTVRSLRPWPTGG